MSSLEFLKVYISLNPAAAQFIEVPELPAV
jgi:hypothetical protein